MFQIIVVASQEINPTCRQLITDHHDWCNKVTGWKPKPCVHGDITETLPPGSFKQSDTFYRRLLDIDRAKICKRQFCYAHSGFCNILEGMQAEFDHSGLPCPDMSKAGHGRREEGVTSAVFARHAKLHIARQTPLLLIENVQDRTTLVFTALFILFKKTMRWPMIYMLASKKIVFESKVGLFFLKCALKFGYGFRITQGAEHADDPETLRQALRDYPLVRCSKWSRAHGCGQGPCVCDFVASRQSCDDCRSQKVVPGQNVMTKTLQS